MSPVQDPRLLAGHASASKQSYRAARSEAWPAARMTRRQARFRCSHKGKRAMARFIPIVHKNFQGNKTGSCRFCTTSQRANWSHRGKAGAEEPRALEQFLRRNKMKNNLTMLGLAL